MNSESSIFCVKVPGTFTDRKGWRASTSIIMRLFIAACLDDDVRDTLIKVQDGLKRQKLKARYTKPENLHMTVAFIGDYGNPEPVLDALETVRFTSLETTFEGLQVHRDMIFARLIETPQMVTTVKRVRRALADAGITFDRKRFMAHITLARGVEIPIRTDPASPPFITADIPKDLRVRISKIALFKSEFTKNGMLYTEIGSI